MINRTLKRLPTLPAVLLILGAAIFTSTRTEASRLDGALPRHLNGLVVSAQKTQLKVAFVGNSAPQQPRPTPDAKATKQNSRPAPTSTPTPSTEPTPVEDTVAYTYEFTHPAFLVGHIVIEHNAQGRGKITFTKRNDETPLVETFELSPAALGRISVLWQGLAFLDSQENYQSDKQFPHLGTMRITMQRGTRKRTAEFNWSNNAQASALVAEYRRAADQAIFVFDISVARENQPLNAPKLMEYLESAVRRNWMSDPQQLLPLLKEISMDEHLPLIARNHATRVIKQISKLN